MHYMSALCCMCIASLPCMCMCHVSNLHCVICHISCCVSVLSCVLCLYYIVCLYCLVVHLQLSFLMETEVGIGAHILYTPALPSCLVAFQLPARIPVWVLGLPSWGRRSREAVENYSLYHRALLWQVPCPVLKISRKRVLDLFQDQRRKGHWNGGGK
jgi:hypothetical protein